MVYIILLALPLVPNLLGFEYSKSVLFVLLTCLLALFWILKKGYLDLKWSQIKLASLGFIFILGLSSIFGLDPATSFWGEGIYAQGWITHLFLSIFFLIVSSADIKQGKIIHSLLGSGLVVSAWGIFQWWELNIWHKSILSYAGRPTSTFGQANFYSGYLILVLPFLWRFSQAAKYRFTAWVAILIFIAAIILSGSRISQALVGLSGVYLLFRQIRFSKKIMVLSILVVLIATLVGLWQGSGIVWDELVRPRGSDWLAPSQTPHSPEKRSLIWPVLLEIAFDRPFLGYGLENISLAYSGYFRSNYHRLFEEHLNSAATLLSLKDLPIDRTHNYPIDLFIFAGLPAVLSWIWLVLLLLKKAKGELLFSLILYLIWVQFQNQSIVHLMFFWLLVGLIDNPRLLNQKIK